MTLIRKTKLRLTRRVVQVDWYPSSRSCVRKANRPIKLQQMPPLMVRKAEWRP